MNLGLCRGLLLAGFLRLTVNPIVCVSDESTRVCFDGQLVSAKPEMYGAPTM